MDYSMTSLVSQLRRASNEQNQQIIYLLFTQLSVKFPMTCLPATFTCIDAIHQSNRRCQLPPLAISFLPFYGACADGSCPHAATCPSLRLPRTVHRTVQRVHIGREPYLSDVKRTTLHGAVSPNCRRHTFRAATPARGTSANVKY